MAFRESPRFPDELAFGAHGGPMFRTDVVVTKGGQEQRNQCWSQALRTYEVSLEHRNAATIALVARFYRAVALGGFHGFRFRDPLPSEATGILEVLGAGDGTTTAFQLVKRYTLAGYVYVRAITKPVVGSVTVQLDAVGTGAFTVDTVTGIVTMTSAPSAGVVVSASYAFDVPVRFSGDWLSKARLARDVWSWQNIQLVETRNTYTPIVLLLGQASESDLAQAVTVVKTRLLGQVSESDLAQAVTARKTQVLGQASETDLAQMLFWAPKHRMVEQVSESNLAQAMGP